ncbi:F-box domain-containing protein [Mycena sanguinolenta]|uniref:F-box domain-containing protein n=1 Tax=Mycena sanguinolenta TaxID=230812 RepID=A0A8H6X9Q1_9AGAR|nr:F-box domain-containing protein [Mycena sanguinolenta]
MPPPCSQCGAFVLSAGDDVEVNLTTAPWTLARFVQLASTNEPPRDPELSLIRPIVEKTSAHLASLDAEISRLQNRLRELEEERTALSIQHSQNTKILSPLRRMPPEILGEIFSWTLPAIDDIFDTNNSWRAVALSKASLWSLITIDFPIKQRYSSQLIRVQMERAHSLKIHFFGSQERDSVNQISLLLTLAEHSDRWKELSIQLTSKMVPYLMSFRDNLAALQRVWVQWHTAESQDPEFNSVDFLQMAISLVDITVYCQYRFLPTRLPMAHQLIRYDFDAPWPTHYELLKSLPNLQQVSISLFDEAEARPDPGEPLELLHLRRLYVGDARSLDYLRAPSLEEISLLVAVGTDSTAPATHLERFIIRSSCSPRSLRLKGILHAPSIAEMLGKYPSFTEVAVTPPDDEDENIQREVLSTFITLFTISKSTLSPLPHITNIGYGSRNAEAIVCPLFLNMLESRWTVGDRACALKAAELLFISAEALLDPRSVARMQTLREAGLQISLLSGRGARDRVNVWLHEADWA